MREFIDWMKGKKTYFVSAAGDVVMFAGFMGWVPPDQVKLWLSFLGLGLVATMRAAMAKSERVLR